MSRKIQDHEDVAKDDPVDEPKPSAVGVLQNSLSMLGRIQIQGREVNMLVAQNMASGRTQLLMMDVAESLTSGKRKFQLSSLEDVMMLMMVIK